jgi:hypothetical protein
MTVFLCDKKSQDIGLKPQAEGKGSCHHTKPPNFQTRDGIFIFLIEGGIQYYW